MEHIVISNPGEWSILADYELLVAREGDNRAEQIWDQVERFETFQAANGLTYRFRN